MPFDFYPFGAPVCLDQALNFLPQITQRLPRNFHSLIIFSSQSFKSLKAMILGGSWVSENCEHFRKSFLSVYKLLLTCFALFPTSKLFHTGNRAYLRKFSSFSDNSVFNYLLNMIFFFLWPHHSIWNFPGQGSNPSYRCDLCHSSSIARSLTHCTTVGTPNMISYWYLSLNYISWVISKS